MYTSIRSFTYDDEGIKSSSSDLITEAPLEIMINESEKTLIMFTPENTRELVIGFLFTEGRVDSISEIEDCDIKALVENGEEIIRVRVKIPKLNSPIAASVRKRVSYSSCGVCGKESYDQMTQGLNRIESKLKVDMELLRQLPDRLYRAQPLYRRTGGAHAAALFDLSGNRLFCYEDMGRHNALDKVIGASLINGISGDDKILVSSGRASLEMMIKTARAGVPLFVAMSRPTSKSVEAAKYFNITLLDMARGGIHIYSHVRRIQGF